MAQAMLQAPVKVRGLRLRHRDGRAIGVIGVNEYVALERRQPRRNQPANSAAESWRERQ
jgi:hypothetical protein